jgi:MraZ protein
MFRGASTLNMDAKGRIAIPARYREAILDRCSGNLVLTVNNMRERCLWLYTLDAWEQAEHKLVELSSFRKDAQYLKRLLIGYASDCEMDDNGRMRISQPLIEFAGLQKQVMLIGQGNKFEIWDEGLWKAKRDEWLVEPEPDGPVPDYLAELSL